MNVMEEMNTKTYSTHHNPNCPSPFLIRLVGKGQLMLDNLPVDETRDVYEYGKTFEEAAKKLLAKCARESVEKV